MTHKYFELEFVDTAKGRAIIRDMATHTKFAYPSYKPTLDERWRALITKTNEFEAQPIEPGSDKAITLEELFRVILKTCGDKTIVGEQREIYYTIRGAYPNLKVNGEYWKDLYEQFIGPFTKRTELIAKLPIQCFGVEAGHRGMLAGEGSLTLEDGTRVPLNAKPALRFELARAGVTYRGNARKVVYYEKEAGFAALVAGDIAQMIETVFATGQGYLPDAAEKFLRDSEERGMQIYCLHDGDPHGTQMMMMYGLASKNSCYMPSRFYPQNVVYLGLVPRVAKELNLPPEEVSDTDRAIIPNLRALLQERQDFLKDVDIIDIDGEKWEYQSLNALNERANQVYLVESLRARNDDIKYVPPAPQLKETISNSITNDVTNLVEENISDFANRFYQEHIKPELVKQLKEKLSPDITEFNDMMLDELPKLDDIPDTDIREAVKLKLVNNPRQFWDNAQYQVTRDMLTQKFDITSNVSWNVIVKEATAEKELVIGDPEIPEAPLTKTDIADSIQRRIVTNKPARDKVVVPIRQALEQVFGEPDQTW